jgi:demethylmenaquinone methyltransferase/2-methoxy-6-polyprenyl-1,4-benzoquinol methylase
MNLQGPNPEEIKSLFNSVAHGYDKANDAMTFGLARVWRNRLVRWSDARHGQRVLDCATGTGDLAIAFKRAVGPSGEVVATDFCAGMLEHGPGKAERLGFKIRFELADAMNLPFADHSFDVASIAYGIRNVSDPAKALSEMARVVRPGGCVLILETGDTRPSLTKQMFDLYFQKVVPRIGGWITGQRGAYEYLNRSSRGFPSRERFIELMASTQAFDTCEYKVLMAGASYMYKGLKAQNP